MPRMMKMVLVFLSWSDKGGINRGHRGKQWPGVGHDKESGTSYIAQLVEYAQCPAFEPQRPINQA